MRTGLVPGGVVGAWLLLVSSGLSQEAERIVDPESPSGLEYYAQGGVVVDGVAYFTSTDGSHLKHVHKSADFPCVVAFDARTLRKLKTYPFARTYDSTPLVFQKRDGTWLVIAHEHEKKRTTAIQRDTGEVDWVSAPNQPGNYFFGYSYFQCDDGLKIIYMACPNGLHAMSAETGEDLWWLRERSTGGITPCVDQRNGWVFYQYNGHMKKLRAVDGKVLATAAVQKPNVCISWNTVLVDDSHGYFVATRWYGAPAWDSAIRVYDADLNLLWQRKKLPHGKKSTITYADGKLVVGSGNGWNANYTGDDWKHIAAYSVSDGEIVWKCGLEKFSYGSVLNTPYFHGSFFAETQDAKDATSYVFRINAETGKLEDVIHYDRPFTSCATSIIAHGALFSGDLHRDGIVATKVAENATADWPGPFGDPQTNQMAAPSDPHAKLVPMRELSYGEVKGE